MKAKLSDAFSGERLQLILMLALTFSTGISDAVGFLGLDRVFTGNMTGNVVILGMALTGAEGLSIWGPLAALVGFLLGAFIAGRLMRSLPTQWTTAKSVGFLASGLVMLVSAAVMFLVPSSLLAPWNVGVTTLLALGMGIQAATARHLATTDVNTVVVTTTLVGLAADSRYSSAKGQLWVRRALSIGLIGLGALVGALTLLIHPAVGVALSAALILLVALIGHFRLASKN